MRYTFLLIAVAALPLAWGSSQAERVAPMSAGEAQFALDIVYRQKIQPRRIRMLPELGGEQRHVPERALSFDPVPSPARSRANMPVVPS